MVYSFYYFLNDIRIENKFETLNNLCIKLQKITHVCFITECFFHIKKIIL